MLFSYLSDLLLKICDNLFLIRALEIEIGHITLHICIDIVDKIYQGVLSALLGLGAILSAHTCSPVR